MKDNLKRQQAHGLIYVLIFRAIQGFFLEEDNKKKGPETGVQKWCYYTEKLQQTYFKNIIKTKKKHIQKRQ